VTIFDIDPITGSITKKGEWSVASNYEHIGLVKLTHDKFVTLIRNETGGRLFNFNVSSNGSFVKKSQLDVSWYEDVVEMACLTSNRIVVGFKGSSSNVIFTTFEVTDLTITQKGSFNWNNNIAKLSLVPVETNRLAAFAVDNNTRLDVLGIYITTAGSIIQSDVKLDVKKPGTTEYLLLKSISGQKMTASGKILLSTVRSTERMAVVPFQMTNGIISAQTGGYFPTAPIVTETSTGFIISNGLRMVASYRLKETGKYRIQSFKWP
jgi:hypothetical protein